MSEILNEIVIVDTFCLILAGMVLLKTRRGSVKETSYNYFFQTTLAVIVYIIGEIGWAVTEYQEFPGRITFGYAIMTLYYLTPTVFSYFFYMLAETRIDKKSVFLKRKWIAALPIVILAVLLLISDCGSHLVFSYETGSYERGVLYPVALILEYISGIFSLIHAVIVILTNLHTSRAASVRVLLAIAIYPVIFGVFQIIFVSLPLESVGFALMLVSILLDMKETEIMQDSLTQMNNRRCLNRHLETLFKQRAMRDKVCLCMIDIDGFKKINDTYGHVSGDEALTVTGEVIKKTVSGFNGFAARFGGDEFVIVLHGENDVRPEALGKQLNDSLALAAADEGLPYPLRLTVGFIRFDPATMTCANDVIKSADKYLYHNKAKVKAE